jgi:hypothetical protein
LGEQVTVAADIYSLGLVLYELLSEARPYRPRDDSPKALEAEVLRGAIERPSAAAPGKSRAEALRGYFDDVVMRALGREPEKRYSSASALADALENRPRKTALGSVAFGRGSKLERLARRNRVAFGVALVAALMAFAALAGSWWEARAAREQASKAHHLTAAVMLVAQQYDTDASARKKVQDASRLNELEREIEKEFVNAPEQLLSLRVTLGEAYTRLEQREDARRVFRRAVEEGASAALPSSPYLQRAREGTK